MREGDFLDLCDCGYEPHSHDCAAVIAQQYLAIDEAMELKTDE